jgi:uncharacterized damage-inducible protein DinB
MKLITIASYSTSAQELLYEFVIARPHSWSEPIETLSQHRTVRSLLAHCVSAEIRWMERIQGSSRLTRYEPNASNDVVDIHRDWRKQRDLTLSIVETADRKELAREIDVAIPASSFHEALAVEDILFHIFNHEGYHRAQCSMLLQHLALDPPNFDFVFLKE